MFAVYIIYSQKLDRYYVGHSEDISARLLQHNAGISAYTSKASDWVLKYKEEFVTRKEAADRKTTLRKRRAGIIAQLTSWGVATIAIQTLFIY